MVYWCVAVHCNNGSDPEKGISVHSFPQAKWKEPAMDNTGAKAEVVLRAPAPARPSISQAIVLTRGFDVQSAVMSSQSGYKQTLVHEKHIIKHTNTKNIQVCAVHEHPSARQ